MLFELKEKNGKEIHLTEERWSHILREHPEVNLEEIKMALQNPIRIAPSKYSPQNVRYYYLFNKLRKHYLLVAVRYLNGHGFIITTYYVRTMQ